VVALDLADVRGPALRQFPHTTWMRLSRIVEGSATVALLIAAEHVARSAGGVTIALDRPAAAGQWRGDSARARRLQRIAMRPRILSARSGVMAVPPGDRQFDPAGCDAVDPAIRLQAV